MGASKQSICSQKQNNLPIESTLTNNVIRKMRVPEILFPFEVFERGLAFASLRAPIIQCESVSKNLETFATFFGSSPAVCATLWSDLQTTDEEVLAYLEQDNTHLEHMLEACHFLFCFNAELTVKDEDIPMHVWFYISKIRALKTCKIVYPEETYGGITLTVDAVTSLAGYTYEVALSLFEDKCIWMNGPFFQRRNALSNFRSGLMDKMAPGGEVGIADKEYQGEPKFLETLSSNDRETLKMFKRRACARQQKFNARIKCFGSLSREFDGEDGFDKHQLCFEAVVVICQYQLETGTLVI